VRIVKQREAVVLAGTVAQNRFSIHKVLSIVSGLHFKSKSI